MPMPLADLSLTRAMLLAVGAALLAIQAPMIAYDIVEQRREIEAAATLRAEAALDMLEAVHTQAMVHRGRTEDGDPAILTLNGSMAQFSEASRGVDLWVFMGPKVVDFQIAAGETEIEPPQDAIDARAVREAADVEALLGETLRVSRAVVLGRGHAADRRCATCHAGIMGLAEGDVIGGFGARVDLSESLATWRADMRRHLLGGAAVMLATLSLILALLRLAALKPLRRLAGVAQRLARGDLALEVGMEGRADELGSMARALDVLRHGLIARARLEREKAEVQTKVQYLASHDPLTGLPNRTLFGERLENAIASATAHGSSAAVLCLDLDHFKVVNDTHGHAAGDAVLQAVAARLRQSIRKGDTAARIGGDEFAIVQTEIADPAEVEALCRRLLESLAAPVRVAGQDVPIGVSIGIALIPGDGIVAASLLRHADVALYQAKEEGRNGYRFFAPEMEARRQEQRAIEQDLRQALEKGELALHYQPLIEVAGLTIIGVEALMRWHHPLRGSVGPATFIPVAEATGLILPLGEWLLRTACRQAAAWPGLVMSVNLSPVQFRHPDLVGMIAGILAETGLPAGRLELEITEGVLLEETEAALAILGALKAMGVRIAMDDFGTGYSSLSYLRSFPFDKLKVDQSFIRVLEQDANAQAIIRSVVALGHTMGMVTTAEGVETPAQLDFLRGHGCDQVQGFHFARPQPAFGIDALLAASASAATGRPDAPATAPVALLIGAANANAQGALRRPGRPVSPAPTGLAAAG